MCDVCIGQTPFDVISEHEEWIRSGYFDKDTQARLKGINFSKLPLCCYHACISLQSEKYPAAGEKY